MRAMSEAELRRAIACDRRGELAPDGLLVTDCPGDCMAHLLGWAAMYVGPLRTAHGWRTPTRGELGAGWPDLTLVRARPAGPPTRGPGRVVFAELKRDGVELPARQLAVLLGLRAADQEVYVWRPCDLDSGRIYRTLRDGPERGPDELDLAALRIRQP